MADSGEGSSQPAPTPAPAEEIAPPQPSGDMDVDELPTSASPSSSSFPPPAPTAPTVDASTPTPVPEVLTPSQDAPPPPAAITDEPLIEKEVQQPQEEEHQPSEVELLRASHLRKEIEQEQAVADALERVTELEKLLDSEKKHVSEAKGREEGLGQSLQHLQTKHAELQQSLNSQSSTNSSLQVKLSNVETSNLALLSTVQDHKDQRDQSQAEVVQLRSKVSAWERRLEEVEGELGTRRLESRNFSFKVEALERALQLSNTDTSAANEELVRVNNTFRKYRSTKDSETQSLHLEVESLRAQLSTSTESLSALRRSQTALSDRLSQSNHEIATLKSSLAEQKTNFRVENSSILRQLEGAERRAEESRTQLVNMEKEREQEQLSLRDSEASSAEERKAWEEEKTELQTKVEELRQTAERLADAAASSSSGYAGAGFGDSAGLLSPTASLATSLMRNKGQSLSDIYVENVKLKNDLGRQEEETKRLEQCLGQVMKDIQERAPVFKQQREEYFHIRDVANDQANQIVVLTTERTTQDQLNSRLHSKLKHAESTVHELERYNSDVSRQKLSLARQLAVRDDPSLVEQLEDEDQFAGDDAQNIVSRSLVTYKSIPELISKNEELVRLTRRLADQMEATQASGGGGANQQYDAAEVELAVEEAQTMNQSLQSKLEEKEVQLLKYVRERDMFSRMLSQAGIVLPVGQRLDEVAGGAGTENVIAVMKQNMEELRKELGLDAERLRGELVEVRKELGGASGRLARVESERDYLKEQLTNQKERNELQQVEFNGLTKQTQLLKDDVNRLNVNLRNAEEKRIDAEGTTERLRTEAANIRAEKELWKTIEARLQSDLTALAKERSTLELLNQNLRNVEAENVRTQTESRQKSEVHITNLERDRAKLREDVTKLKAAAVSDLSGIIAEKNTLKTERDQAVAEVEAIKSRLDNVTTNLTAYRQKSETDRLKFQEFMGKRTAERNQSAAEIKALTDQIAQHTTELQNKTNEATLASKQLQIKSTEYDRLRVKLSMVEPKALAAAPLLEKVASLETERNTLLAKIKATPAAPSSLPVPPQLRAELEKTKSERDSLAAQLKAATDAATTSGVPVDQRITDLSTERDNLKELLRLAQTATPSDPDTQRKITELEAELDSTKAKLAITDIDAKLKEQQEQFLKAKAAYVTSERSRYETVFKDAKRLSILSKSNAKKMEETDLQIAALQAQLAEAQANPPPTTTTTATTDSDPAAPPPPPPVAQDVIDSAVQAAVAQLQTSHEEALAARERQVREELASVAPPAAPATSSEPTPTVDVDLAVKNAVTARESELQEAHAAQLAAREKELSEKTKSTVEEAVKSAIAALPPPPPPAPAVPTPTDPKEIETAVKAAVEARETELNRLHEEALKAATAAAAAPSTSTPAPVVPEDLEARKAEIEVAVRDAVEREKREAGSKTAAQKGALDRVKTQKADLTKENLALKQQLAEAQAKISASPVVPSPPTRPNPTGGARAVPIPPRQPQASTSTAAAGASTLPPTPTGPTTRQRASIGGTAVPTAPGGGASIRGASTAAGGRGRGGAAPGGPSTRGGATTGTATRGGATGAGAGRGGARKPPGNLFSGAMEALQPSGGATKRPREEDSAPSPTPGTTPLLARLNAAAAIATPASGLPGGRPVIKRPKKEGEPEAGEGGGA